MNAPNNAPQPTDLPEIELVAPSEREDLNLDALASAAEEAPAIQLANSIVRQAIKARATEVLIEPQSDTIRLRYRIDGELAEYPALPPNHFPALVSRLKIMSYLDIAERRLPQDGRMRVTCGETAYAFRVCLVPTVYGERCQLQMTTSSDRPIPKLDKLGMEEETLKRFRKALSTHSGLAIVAGPTGSGKTTTLYSALAELIRPERDIVTIEDPVEFALPGISQVQVRPEIGMTFSAALRSVLRQAPDIILVGEIRDSETAELAAGAAMRGNQVLCNMHCNDAAGAITRLDDMGIAPFVISSSMALVCAQRLVRKICPSCVEQIEHSPTAPSETNVNPDFFASSKLFRGKGCERCNQTGYYGRVGLFEVLLVDEEIRKLILARSPAKAIADLAAERGMLAIQDAALAKVRQGITTMEQAIAVLSAQSMGMA